MDDDLKAIVLAVLFASFIGTYMDLLFVGCNLYTFPVRPLASVFSVNIAFTLFLLPLVTAVFLRIARKLHPFSRFILIVFIGLLAGVGEQLAETFGWFIHSRSWHHSYSIFGYIVFLLIIWRVYRLFLK